MRKLKFEGGVESKLAESEILDTARSQGPPPLTGVETLQHRYLILGTAGSSRAWLDSEQVFVGFPLLLSIHPKSAIPPPAHLEKPGGFLCEPSSVERSEVARKERMLIALLRSPVLGLSNSG